MRAFSDGPLVTSYKHPLKQSSQTRIHSSQTTPKQPLKLSQQINGKPKLNIILLYQVEFFFHLTMLRPNKYFSFSCAVFYHLACTGIRILKPQLGSVLMSWRRRVMWGGCKAPEFLATICCLPLVRVFDAVCG